MLGFWLAAILFVLLLATIPVYPYNRSWGYLPLLVTLGLLLALGLLVWLNALFVTWPWAGPPAATVPGD
jgi:hypothetical protein